MIHDCGARTNQVEMALDHGKGPLGAAINAARSGIAGGHGFQAFFKNNAAGGSVVTMLKNVQTMKAIRGLKPNRFSASQPEFVCVDRRTLARYPKIPNDPWAICRVSGSFGLWLRGWKYVFLCPRFFTLPTCPTERRCPGVKDNMFEMTGFLLADFQSYVLMHEMIHFYLGRSSLGWDTTPAEKYKLNECVAMDPKDSLKNPMHYQYYVASQYTLSKPCSSYHSLAYLFSTCLTSSLSNTMLTREHSG